MISYRYFVLMRSAAFRKTAARSANGRLSQLGFAAKADSIACLTSAGEALLYLATGVECDEGLTWVKMFAVVIYHKQLMRKISSTQRQLVTYRLAPHNKRDIQRGSFLKSLDGSNEPFSFSGPFSVVFLRWSESGSAQMRFTAPYSHLVRSG